MTAAAKFRLIKIKNLWDSFLFGKWFPPACALLMLLTWVTGFVAAAAVILSIILCYVLFFHRSAFPIVTISAMIIPAINLDVVNSGADGSFTKYLWLLGLIPFIVAGIIFYFVKNKIKFRLGKTFPAALAFSLIIFLSGILSPFYTNKGNILAMVYQALIYMFFIFLIFNMVPRLDLSYLAWMMHFVAWIVFSEILIYYFREGFDNILKGDLKFGWGISNNVGASLATCIPATLYLAVKNRKLDLLYIVNSLVFLCGVFFTLSRATIIAVLIVIPILLIYMVVKTEKNYRNTFAVKVFVSVFVMLTMFIIMGLNSDVFGLLLGRGFSSSGRTNIYKEAIKTFLAYPLFGAGFEYSKLYSEWFTGVHNTIFQYLASGGIIGFCSMLYFYVRRYLLFFDDWKPQYIFFLAAALIFELFGMLDVWLHPVSLFIVCYCFMAIEKDTEKPAKQILVLKKEAWRF